MSSRELDRLQMLVRVPEGRTSQADAARVLGLSPRQLRRIWSAYKAHGAAALASRQRGRPSNRRLAHELRELALVRDRYSDFGPTFAHEKLTEVHGLQLSVSTLRTWMTEDGLWVPRAQRDRRVHQARRRRECLGELVQIDGSDHRWFEERAPKCTLLVFIDDATGRLMTLHFCESESTFSYFAAAEKYVARHGKPVAFYSDKASVFRVNAKAPKSVDGWTQVRPCDARTRRRPKVACKRANLTLQNRLVKELRLADISTMDAANAFAWHFLEDYNRRFGRPALSPHNAHRPLRDDERLKDVFTSQEKRKVSRSLTLHYKRVMYLLDKTDAARRAMGKHVDVVENEAGDVTLYHDGHELPAQAFDKLRHVRQAAIVENKMLSAALQFAAEQQAVRDKKRLSGPSVTMREKRLLLDKRHAAAE